MQVSRPRLACGVLVGLWAPLVIGCATHTQTGALLGTGVGTGLGAIIGHQIGKGKEGALIGAAIGAGSGALAGNSRDAIEQRDAAYRHASYVEARHRAHTRAMTNRDILDMQYGPYPASDELVMSTIRDRNGFFDTSPAGIMSLKQSGVSERVIQCMQQNNLYR